MSAVRPLQVQQLDGQLEEPISSLRGQRRAAERHSERRTHAGTVTPARSHREDQLKSVNRVCLPAQVHSVLSLQNFTSLSAVRCEAKNSAGRRARDLRIVSDGN